MNFNPKENVRDVLQHDNVVVIHHSRNFRGDILEYKRIMSGYVNPLFACDYEIEYDNERALAMILIEDVPRIYIKVVK